MLLTTRNSVRQLACGVQQREVLLVGLHRQDQALLRHRQELGLEAADQHVGALDQGRRPRPSSASSSMGLQAARRAVCAARPAARTISARRSAELAITAPCSSQLFGVAVGMASIAIGGAAGLEPVALGAALPERKPSACTGTTSAPCKATRPWAGRTKLTLLQPGSWHVALQLVAHDLGDGQLGNGFVQRLLQAFGQGDARRRRCPGTAPRLCRPAARFSCGTTARRPRPAPPASSASAGVALAVGVQAPRRLASASAASAWSAAWRGHGR